VPKPCDNELLHCFPFSAFASFDLQLHPLRFRAMPWRNGAVPSCRGRGGWHIFKERRCVVASILALAHLPLSQPFLPPQNPAAFTGAQRGFLASTVELRASICVLLHRSIPPLANPSIQERGVTFFTAPGPFHAPCAPRAHRGAVGTICRGSGWHQVRPQLALAPVRSRDG
jgi:hypothetical protein